MPFVLILQFDSCRDTCKSKLEKGKEFYLLAHEFNAVERLLWTFASPISLFLRYILKQTHRYDVLSKLNKLLAQTSFTQFIQS